MILTVQRRSNCLIICLIKITLSIFIANNRSVSQTLPSVQVNIEKDYAVFQADDENWYVEVYMNVPVTMLDKNSTELNESDSVYSLTLESYSNNRLIKKTKIPIVILPSALSNYNTILQVGQVLSLGDYNLKVGLSCERHNKLLVEENLRVVLPKRNTYTSYISNIQVAKNAYKSSNTNSLFHKNTYEVIPNASRVFNDEDESAYFYFEIYYLSSQSLPDKIYQRSYLKRNNLVLNNTERIKQRGKSIDKLAVIERIQLSELISGSYEFNLELTDSNLTTVSKSSAKFYLINTSVKSSKNETSISDYNELEAYSESDIEEMRNYVDYIMQSDEKDSYDKTTSIEDKIHFFEKFWSLRGGKSAYSIYMNQIDKVNKMFGKGFIKGYKSARGKIMLKYGEPSTISRFDSESQTKPYEVWSYDNLKDKGSAIFVFADLSGFNRYELIHSTAIGEISNENWRQIVGQAGLGEDMDFRGR